MTEEDNIHKLFQDVFENLEVAPPVSVKMEIDKQLGPKRKFRFIFWWLPVLILLVGGIAFAVVRYSSDESEVKQSPAVSQLNTTSTGSGGLSSDHLSQNEEQNENEKQSQVLPEENERKRQGENEAENEKQLVTNQPRLNAGNRGGTKRQGFTLKKGSTSQSAEKKSSKKQAGSSKFGKSDTAAKFKKSKKGPKRGLGDVSKASVGSKGRSKTPGNSKQKLDPGKTTVSGSPQKIDPADLKSKGEDEKTSPGKDEKSKDKLSKQEPADSVQKADSLATAAKTDSLTKPGEEPEKVKPPKDDSKAKNWMVELYGGPRFGVKTSKTDFALKEATSYQIGLGFSRRLELGPLKYVTLDGEYGSGKETYKQNVTTSSIYFVGIDSIPYFDTIGDTIPAGYTYINNYDTTTSTIENTRNSTITRFAFGLKAQFNFNLGGGFGLAVVPGYYYSMSKFKFSDSGNVSASSSQILLGLGVYYDWNRFRFRIGLDTRYELMRKNDNLIMDRRKSMLFNPQFGIAVKF